MTCREEIVELLTLQKKEVEDHKLVETDPICLKSLDILFSVTDCILDDLSDPTYPWKHSDIKEWQMTLDSTGLCESAMNIY